MPSRVREGRPEPGPPLASFGGPHEAYYDVVRMSDDTAPAPEEPLELNADTVMKLAKLAKVPPAFLEAALSMRLQALSPSVFSDAIAREALRRIERRQELVLALSCDPENPAEQHPLMTDRTRAGADFRKDIREEDRAIREDSRIVLQAIKDSQTYDGVLSPEANYTDNAGESDALTRKLRKQRQERAKMERRHREAMSGADAAAS